MAIPPASPRWLLPGAFFLSAMVVIFVVPPLSQPRSFGPDMGFLGPLGDRETGFGPLYPRLAEEGKAALTVDDAGVLPSPDRAADDPTPPSEP
jgi:hypothetical protein